ncbi:MAG: hypothetical protein D6795_11240, partial [Deltaproteobacteria bacterium]
LNDTDDIITLTAAYTEVDNSLRTPIMYDLNNTAYYVDPAGTTRLNNLTITGTCTGCNTGSSASGWTDDGAVVRLTTASDKVGIGTTSPAGKLTVSQTNSSISATTSHLLLENPSGAQTTQYFTFGGTQKGSIRVDSSGNLVFNAASGNVYFDNDFGPTTINFRAVSGVALSMMSNGNVGVGTTSPAYKLDVAGDIRASGAIMGGNHITHTQWYGATNNYRGYIKLITPIVHNESNMFSIHIMGYGYAHGSDAIDIRCGGYAYSASTLISTDCHTEGTDLPVEIGTETRSGRKVVVIRIGTPTTNWYYPHFSAEYVGWIKKNPSDFVWTVGETSPAQT